MIANDISSDLISAIDRMGNVDRKEVHNPVSELITPEWHFSNSVRVLDDIQISWDNLRQSSLIQELVKGLENNYKEVIVGIEFERSFCSWYQSYHYLPREKWGIHVRYDSLVKIASLFYLECPSTFKSRLDSANSAFLYLFFHQLFHHIVENASSIMEILVGKPNLYTKYYTDIYSQVFNSPNCLEEALSNSYLFQWAEECRLDKQFLKDQLLKQGPGYSKFINYSDLKLFGGIRILLSQIRNSHLNPASYDPIEQLVDVPNPFQYSQSHDIPIWLHFKAKPVR